MPVRLDLLFWRSNPTVSILYCLAIEERGLQYRLREAPVSTRVGQPGREMANTGYSTASCFIFSKASSCSGLIFHSASILRNAIEGLSDLTSMVDEHLHMIAETWNGSEGGFVGQV